MPRTEQILVRGVNWLGDAVMTTPALQRLREAKSDARITLLTPAKLADLWRHHPALDAVVTFERGESVFQVAKRLRENHYALALVFPNSPRSALEVFLGRIPHRVGYARTWRSFLLTIPVQPRAEAVRMRKRSTAEIHGLIVVSKPREPRPINPAAHHIHDYLHLVAALGANPQPLAPHVAVIDEEVSSIKRRFDFPADRPSPPRLFGLNPGAEYGPAKRWPRERFVAAAIELQRKTNCHWWIFGGSAERDLARAIAGEIEHAKAGESDSVRCLAGETSLREMCAGLKACDVVLTNDTGPMHVAAAVGTPVVVPFGSTSPELTAPGLPGDSRHVLLRSNAPCAPCFLRECPIDFRCMTGISVEAVVSAVLQIIR